MKYTNFFIIILVIVVLRVMLLFAGFPISIPILDDLLYAIGDLIRSAGQGIAKSY